MSFAIALVNISDGSVQGHKAGCADLTRGALRKHADEVWNLEVDSKHEAWDAYSSDFIAECDHDGCDVDAGRCSNAYVIDWKPCASHVPDFEDATEAVVETTMKVCGKWTRFYQDGVEVGRVANDAADAVFALIRS